jgi:hypothetical protein
LIKIIFKNVGQGDSILIRWEKDSQYHYGIIDCNLYKDKNPLLEEIVLQKIRCFDFVILSHLHYDHYSGLGSFFKYCIDTSIKIKSFLHTFTVEYLHILDMGFVPKKQEYETELFLESMQSALDKKIIERINDVSNVTGPIQLTDDIDLSFLAPWGEDSIALARERANYKNNKSLTFPDMNRMSTIIKVSNKEYCLLLTSDARKKAFRRIPKSITEKILLAQAPHHGSNANLYYKFWDSLTISKSCPCIFSVGDVKRDKLPNKEVVQFFEEHGFHNLATNFVYGLQDYYPTFGLPPGIPSEETEAASRLMKPFARKVSTTSIPVVNNRFNGDKEFVFF